MAAQNITAVTPSNRWIHFLLSFLCPPTSYNLYTSPLFLFSPTGLQNQFSLIRSHILTGKLFNQEYTVQRARKEDNYFTLWAKKRKKGIKRMKYRDNGADKVNRLTEDIVTKQIDFIILFSSQPSLTNSLNHI